MAHQYDLSFQNLINGNQNASLIASGKQAAAQNTQQSQNFAREQMAFQEASNAKAMRFSADEAQKSRDYQERLSNTAHQREVQDLISAGLNPVLSAMKGASTPGGASAQGVSSSGASGKVDEGVTSMISGLLNAVVGQATALQTTSMNNSNALDITKMNNEMAQIISKIGASAQLGSANINARSNQYMQSQQIELEKFLKENYPQTIVGGASSIANKLIDLLNGSNPSAKGQNNFSGAVSGLGESIQYLQNQDFKDLNNYGALGQFLKKFKKTK